MADLSSMIDEVLKMAKDRQTAGRWQGADWKTGAQVDASDDEDRKARVAWQANQDAIGARQQLARGDLEKQGLVNQGNMDVQKLHNAGAMDVTKTTDAGQTARAMLTDLATRRGQDLDLEGKKYGADTLYKGHELTSKATVTASENRLLGDAARANATLGAAKYKGGDENKDATSTLNEMIKSGMITTPEDALKFRQRLNAKAPAAEDAKSFLTADPSPATIAPPAPAIPAPAPVSGFDKEKSPVVAPAPVPTVKIPAPPIAPPPAHTAMPEGRYIPGVSPKDMAGMTDEEYRRKRKELFFNPPKEPLATAPLIPRTKSRYDQAAEYNPFRNR